MRGLCLQPATANYGWKHESAGRWTKYQMADLVGSQAQQRRGSMHNRRRAAGICFRTIAQSGGIGRHGLSNSWQTAGTLARLQQRAVLGKGFIEEDDALQRGLDACFAQFVDARLERRVYSKDGN